MSELIIPKPLKDLRTVGIWEGISYLVLLFVAMPLKYFAGLAMAVRLMGTIHGILFILFIYCIFNAMSNAGMSFRKAIIAFVASLIPFATFYLDKLIFKQK